MLVAQPAQAREPGGSGAEGQHDAEEMDRSISPQVGGVRSGRKGGLAPNELRVEPDSCPDR
jgi:hypothetical protein